MCLLALFVWLWIVWVGFAGCYCCFDGWFYDLIYCISLGFCFALFCFWLLVVLCLLYLWGLLYRCCAFVWFIVYVCLLIKWRFLQCFWVGVCAWLCCFVIVRFRVYIIIVLFEILFYCVFVFLVFCIYVGLFACLWWLLGSLLVILLVICGVFGVGIRQGFSLVV